MHVYVVRARVVCVCVSVHLRSHTGDRSFGGIVVLPGNGEELTQTRQYHENRTWLDQALGPTFNKLIHALNIDRM